MKIEIEITEKKIEAPIECEETVYGSFEVF